MERARRRAGLFEPTDELQPLETPSGTFSVPATFVELARIGDPAPRSRTVCLSLPPALAAAGATTICSMSRPIPTSPGHGDGQGGPSRRAQDARLRPLPRSRPRAGVAFRRLVRAGAPHRRTGRAVFRAPVCRHGVVDPDAGGLRALGRARRLDHAGRAARPMRRRRTGWRKSGGATTPASSTRPG